MIVELWKVKRSSNSCRRVKIWSMHLRAVHDPSCSSRVCSSHVLHNLQTRKDLSKFDTTWIRLIFLRAAHCASSSYKSDIDQLLWRRGDILGISNFGEQYLKFFNQFHSSFLNITGGRSLEPSNLHHPRDWVSLRISTSAGAPVVAVHSTVGGVASGDADVEAQLNCA